jgi:hypothetical protein
MPVRAIKIKNKINSDLIAGHGCLFSNKYLKPPSQMRLDSALPPLEFIESRPLFA